MTHTTDEGYKVPLSQELHDATCEVSRSAERALKTANTDVMCSNSGNVYRGDFRWLFDLGMSFRVPRCADGRRWVLRGG